MVRWLIRLHKWAALVIGIQMLAWVGGGLFMTAIPIERVRGEHNVAEQSTPALLLIGLRPAGDVARDAGIIPRSVEIRPWMDRTVYEFSTSHGPVMADARTGEILSPISMDTALRIAQADYAGEASVSAILYVEEPTSEYRRPGPVWRADFADGEGTRIYVDARTGEVSARRNNVWRLYDFFWALHIMNFGDRSNYNHPLLVLATLFAFGMSLIGFVLLFPWLARMIRRQA